MLLLFSNLLCLSMGPSRFGTGMFIIPNFLHTILEYSHSFNKCIMVSFSKHLSKTKLIIQTYYTAHLEKC